MLVFAAAKVVIFFEIKKENQNKNFKGAFISLLSAQDEYTYHLHGFPYHKDQP